ncbi:MAG: hypothetical protein HC809_13465, partial [Gammaproteobacteria bacterium]|nr:hypothetical protein [Gammaproteobacteria bacterium]
MSVAANSYPKPRTLAILTALIGLVLLVLGIRLAGLGGSLYYAIGGLVLLVCGVMAFRGDRRAAPLYGGFFLATLVWAIYEVGLDAWALVPRLAFFAALGLWFLLPRVRRGLLQTEPAPLLRQPITWGALGGAAVFIVAVVVANTGYEVRPRQRTWQRHHRWRQPRLGTLRREPRRHTLCTARRNQSRHRGESRTCVDFSHQGAGTFKGTPIQAGDGLYLCTGKNIIVSLDADSGAERWRFDPEIDARLRNLRESKSALLARLELVLDACEEKGGDPGELRRYAAAVSGANVDVRDVGATWKIATEWFTSKEG